jgi:hypothetical protein
MCVQLTILRADIDGFVEVAPSNFSKECTSTTHLPSHAFDANMFTYTSYSLTSQFRNLLSILIQYLTISSPHRCLWHVTTFRLDALILFPVPSANVRKRKCVAALESNKGPELLHQMSDVLHVSPRVPDIASERQRTVPQHTQRIATASCDVTRDVANVLS